MVSNNNQPDRNIGIFGVGQKSNAPGRVTGERRVFDSVRRHDIMKRRCRLGRQSSTSLASRTTSATTTTTAATDVAILVQTGKINISSAVLAVFGVRFGLLGLKLNKELQGDPEVVAGLTYKKICRDNKTSVRDQQLTSRVETK